MELDILLESPDLRPGPLLRDLARVGALTHFIAIGFDPLLERALSEVRYGVVSRPALWEFAPGGTPQDLPFGLRDAPKTLLACLFGRVSPNPSFHLWDHDAIEFVWSLSRSLPTLNTLAAMLASSNVLFIGSDFSDWLVRFFLRVIKNKPLNEDKRLPFLLAERKMRREPESVLFYDALGGGIEFVHEDPLTFARAFTARALCSFALPDSPQAPPPPPPADREIPQGAIFVSYAHADAEPVFALVERLREAGCLVWLDRERLLAGDNFDNHLEDAVKRHCSLFLSVISPTTESRSESYFHKERRWAAMRFEDFAPDAVFYIPVALGDVALPPRREPRAFAQANIVRLGPETDALVARLHTLQQERLRQR